MRGRIRIDPAMDVNELSGKVIGAAIEVHKIFARPPRLSELLN